MTPTRAATLRRGAIAFLVVMAFDLVADFSAGLAGLPWWSVGIVMAVGVGIFFAVYGAFEERRTDYRKDD